MRDRAAIQAARVNVAYTKITSPINGVVGLRQVDPGNIVHAADATGLILVTQLQPIAVIFTLPEDQIPAVLKLMRAGRKLVVEAYDRSMATHLGTGTLLTVDNQIDTTTGTLKAKAVFDNRDNALFPNQFVNVRLVLEERQNSLVVPAAAIQTGAAGNFVYLVKEGKAPRDPNAPGGGGRGKGKRAAAADSSAPDTSAAAPAAGGDEEAANGEAKKPAGPQYYVTVQPVAVDLTEGSQVVLKEGVKPGDQVVTDGQEKLKPYSKVTPKQAPVRARGANGGSGTPAEVPSTPAAAADVTQGAGASDDAGQSGHSKGRHVGQDSTQGATPDPGASGKGRHGGQTKDAGSRP